ncbi:MAG: TetR/AcrR family transcriptional regulator [Paracoccaceae bacterium]
MNGVADRMVGIYVFGMVKRLNKRDDILAAVVVVLSRDGLQGLSAAVLAAEAGVSKANLFHHFSGLDEIVLEAFRRFALGLEMLDPPQGTGLREWLQGMGEASFGMDAAAVGFSRAYFVFVSKALFDPELRLQVLGTVNAASAVVQRIVGEMGGTDAERLGDLIFMTGDAMALHLIAFPERRERVIAAWGLFVDQVAPGS